MSGTMIRTSKINLNHVSKNNAVTNSSCFVLFFQYGKSLLGHHSSTILQTIQSQCCHLQLFWILSTEKPAVAIAHNVRFTIVMKLEHSWTKKCQISLDCILWKCKIRMECNTDICEHKNLTVCSAVQCFLGQIKAPKA